MKIALTVCVILAACGGDAGTEEIDASGDTVTIDAAGDGVHNTDAAVDRMPTDARPPVDAMSLDAMPECVVTSISTADTCPNSTGMPYSACVDGHCVTCGGPGEPCCHNRLALYQCYVPQGSSQTWQCFTEDFRSGLCCATSGSNSGAYDGGVHCAN